MFYDVSCKQGASTPVVIIALLLNLVIVKCNWYNYQIIKVVTDFCYSFNFCFLVDFNIYLDKITYFLRICVNNPSDHSLVLGSKLPYNNALDMD